MDAFRGKRWLTWILGVPSFLTGVVTAFAGYASPEDFVATTLTELIGTVLYITALGLYQLFIEELPMRHWLKADRRAWQYTGSTGRAAPLPKYAAVSVVTTIQATGLYRYVKPLAAHVR